MFTKITQFPQPMLLLLKNKQKKTLFVHWNEAKNIYKLYKLKIYYIKYN